MRNLLTECSEEMTQGQKHCVLRKLVVTLNSILTKLVWSMLTFIHTDRVYCNFPYDEPVLQINNNLKTAVAVLHYSWSKCFFFWTDTLLVYGRRTLIGAKKEIQNAQLTYPDPLLSL